MLSREMTEIRFIMFRLLVTGISEQQKMAILEQHNSLRMQQSASDMQEMVSDR